MVKPANQLSGTFGLDSETINRINLIFKACDKVDEVIIYGSRAKGSYRKESDIDLTLKGESLTQRDINIILSHIDELLLPYEFDLSIFHHIANSDLLDHIQKIGKVF